MEYDDLYRNLVVLLKMFNNRPYHLAKYLIDNDALRDNFIKNISDNGKLNDISKDDDVEMKLMYFLDIGKMNDYYNKITDEVNLLALTKSPEEIEFEINEKLDNLIFDENYEEAVRLRDYMITNKIKRLK